MDRAGILDELVVHVGGLHLGFEGGDVLRGHVRVVGAMEGEDLRLDILTVGRGRRVEAAMETHDALHVGTGTGQLDDGRAAEAVAGGGKLGGIRAPVLSEHGEGVGGSLTEEGAVTFILTRFLAGGRRLGADALAVDVGDEDIVTEGR